MKIVRSLHKLFQTPAPPPSPPVEESNADSGEYPHTLRCKVFACLETGYLHVKVGFEIGFLYDAPLREIEVKHFPANCRMPNTIVEITFDKAWNVLKIALAKQCLVNKGYTFVFQFGF